MYNHFCKYCLVYYWLLIDIYISNDSIFSNIWCFIFLLGFIMMTPQLFINYKLKSVAHLPWRMLSYKFLNTFIDDIFAFVIKMPTMYRLGCFRDGKCLVLKIISLNIFQHYIWFLHQITAYWLHVHNILYPFIIFSNLPFGNWHQFKFKYC